MTLVGPFQFVIFYEYISAPLFTQTIILVESFYMFLQKLFISVTANNVRPCLQPTLKNYNFTTPLILPLY